MKQIYLGIAATATVREMETGGAAETQKEQFNGFRTDCKDFLIEAILQIRKRFDLDAEIHTIVRCMMPANAVQV